MTYTIREAHHHIRINLNTPQPFTDICNRTRNVHGLRLNYTRTRSTYRVTITVEYRDSATHVFPVETIPDWMQHIIDAHKPTGPALQLT